MLTSQGLCEKFYDDNCLEFNSLGCKTCKDGSLKINLKDKELEISQCRPNDMISMYSLIENCLTHDLNGFCLKCASGYALNFNNLSCHLLEFCAIFDSRKRVCISCLDQYFVHSSGSCEKGTLANCKTYLNENQCSACVDGFLLKSFFNSDGVIDYKRCIPVQTLGKIKKK